ncbi:MAG: diaminopimelate decarboxylase [Actinomycetota bacterium]|nr:diaminopimelate decarboxylase [Actinomycetota bacterium]
MISLLPDTASTASGRLVVGGCDAVDLAARFGTPLVVLDRATIEARALSYADVVGPNHVFYAAKALCCVGLLELLARCGLGVDVCTGGELATALQAGFPADRIVFHGNNKSLPELRAAGDAGVGRIVVDSFEEIDRLAQVGLSTKLLIRVTPGVEAHTHEFVQTGQEDSKFGFTLAGEVALDALRRASGISGCEVVGVHAHIGSQIFDLAAFELAVQRLAAFLATAHGSFGFVAAELNLGGGLGIAHTPDELTPDPKQASERLLIVVEREFDRVGLPVPGVFVEPGRSIIGSAAVTLYEVGTVKKIEGVRTYVAVDGGMSDHSYQKGLPSPEQTDRVYVSVDGGMSDNPRFPLYGAKYEAFLANRTNDEPTLWTTVAGKHCESGDILVKDVQLPADVRAGDLLCIPATGAYTYSMASNYNHVPRPAIVMVEEGRAVEIVRRETYDDLLRLDRRLDGSPL